METAYPLSERKLDKIFNPGTIAVIGASDREGGVGNALMKNLIGNNYRGIVYPVNPARESVQGIKAYPKIGDIPDKIDLAIIATPAPRRAARPAPISKPSRLAPSALAA